MTSSRRPALCVWLALAVAGCNYAADEKGASFETNSCSFDTDCGADAACRAGMCVARSADATLAVALQVTPLRMPDGSDPVPVVLQSFAVDGPISRTFTLPAAATVQGSIDYDGVPIDAEIRFTPVGMPRGFAPRVTTVSASAETRDGEPSFRAQLLRGVEYRARIRPSDPNLPPYTHTLRAGEGALHVDFAALPDAEERVLTVEGAPAGRTLLVRAFDLQSGEAVSSTGSVVDGKAVLRFAVRPGEVRYEIRAEQSYASTVVLEGAACDTETPDFPVFSVDEAALDTAEDGSTLITLPEAPARIRFEGRVGLCSDAPSDVVLTESLPVTLHARSLILPSDSPLVASYETTTTATLDSTTGELRFCVEIMPGEYDVLATPPSNIPCAIFAERRLIAAPASGSGASASGALLTLPLAAYLTGTLKTPDRMPMRGATIEAVALGRSHGVELSETDASVTRYNRSRQTTSDDDGAFQMAIDLGSYDVLVKPPAGSGFPWQVRHDVNIAARAVPFATIIDMLSPVTLDGRLRYEDGPGEFEGAEVAAFAIVPDELDPESMRALPIGKASADHEGRFTLLLPPSIHHGW